MSFCKKHILEAMADAVRFIDLAKQALSDGNAYGPSHKHIAGEPVVGTRLNGAVKRASLDLDRSLARMRNPNDL